VNDSIVFADVMSLKPAKSMPHSTPWRTLGRIVLKRFKRADLAAPHLGAFAH